ncbi:MAG TPA: hypothetical protein VIL72_12915 [Beijerinckiaceae bacterium]|jgi:hypothetical protein
MSHGVMLVGSIPYETAREAMETFGGALGASLRTLPDGEVGWRRFWITRVHFQVLAVHPDLEVVQHPRRDDGVERIFPHDAGDNWNFRVRDGVSRVVFGHPGWRLGYHQDAVNSYEMFKALKARGAIPADLRFQVSMPSAVSALPPRVFPTPGDLEKVLPGYEDAVRAELAAIAAYVPHNELAVQWDCSTEMQNVYGAADDRVDEVIARDLASIRRLSEELPADVELGFHLCFGTLGGWPRFAPDSPDRAVRLARAFIAGAGRRVDLMHVPLLDRVDEAYYAPLAQLGGTGARVYLGMIHAMDTLERRVALARAVLPDFGLAAYCGFGRRPPDELAAILRDHMAGARLLNGGARTA